MSLELNASRNRDLFNVVEEIQSGNQLQRRNDGVAKEVELSVFKDYNLANDNASPAPIEPERISLLSSSSTSTTNRTNTCAVWVSIICSSGVYEGECKPNVDCPEDPQQPHGTGKMTFNNGDVYEGEWNEGNPHGKGKMAYENGDVYEGEWNEGKPHGKGKMTHKYRDVYEGEWNEGKLHGKGTITFSDGRVLSGESWSNGSLAKGKLKFAGGSVYEGQFLNPEAQMRQTGWGTQTYGKGGKYIGQWDYGFRGGFGIHISGNGEIDIGFWKNNGKESTCTIS